MSAQLKKFAHAAAALALAALAQACAATTAESVKAAQAPSLTPTPASTGFSQGLQCMDDMFHDYGVRNVLITTKGVPDSTGEISAGTREMLISAVSRMSERSRAFVFVDFQPDLEGPSGRMQQLQEMRVTPYYYIRGAISQLDESVLAKTAGAGLKIGDISAGANKDDTVSVVTVDMNVGELRDGVILSGISSNSSIAVRRRGVGADASAQIEKNGAFFQFGLSKSEGMHQAVRTLIELNTIEVLGKLARVPYWRCLDIPASNPAVLNEARRWFTGMDEGERISFAKRALAGLGAYAGPVDSKDNPQFRDAVGAYRAANGLTGAGVDFELYASLLAKGGRLVGDAVLAGAPAGLKATAAAQQPLFISLTDALEQPTYGVGDPLQIRATLNRDGFLACYYQDGQGQVARVFPNAWQPDPFLPAGRRVLVPDPKAGFSLVFESRRSSEQVACYAAESSFTDALPEALKQPDLEYLPVRSIADVRAAVLAASPGAVESKVEFIVR